MPPMGATIPSAYTVLTILSEAWALVNAAQFCMVKPLLASKSLLLVGLAAMTQRVVNSTRQQALYISHWYCSSTHYPSKEKPPYGGLEVEMNMTVLLDGTAGVLQTTQ